MQATASASPNLHTTIQSLIDSNKDLKKQILETPDALRCLDSGVIELDAKLIFDLETFDRQSLLILHLLK